MVQYLLLSRYKDGSALLCKKYGETENVIKRSCHHLITKEK